MSTFEGRSGTVVSVHYTDDDGQPAGGRTTGVGMSLVWQDGPLGPPGERRQPNGTFVEDVLAAVRDRLVWYQAGLFSCDENGAAIAAVDEALAALASRRADRVRRGVDGTHAD